MIVITINGLHCIEKLERFKNGLAFCEQLLFKEVEPAQRVSPLPFPGPGLDLTDVDKNDDNLLKFPDQIKVFYFFN